MSTPGGNGTDGTIAALGDPALLQGFRLAGAAVYPAVGEAEVRTAWAGLPETVVAVVLTPAAADVLGEALDDPASPLTAVLPR